MCGFVNRRIAPWCSRVRLKGKQTYVWVGVSTDDDLNRARAALTQNRVHIVQRHVANHRVIDLHDLIATSDKHSHTTY